MEGNTVTLVCLLVGTYWYLLLLGHLERDETKVQWGNNKCAAMLRFQSVLLVLGGLFGNPLLGCEFNLMQVHY